MPELTYLGFSLLLCLAAWHLALRKSIQDSYKDRLFDVRDEMRRHFAEQNALDTDACRVLRDTINRYIRFVEVTGFVRAFLFSRNMAANPTLAHALKEHLDGIFLFDDPHHRCYGRMVRKKCASSSRMFSAPRWWG